MRGLRGHVHPRAYQAQVVNQVVFVQQVHILTLSFASLYSLGRYHHVQTLRLYLLEHKFPIPDLVGCSHDHFDREHLFDLVELKELHVSLGYLGLFLL